MLETTAQLGIWNGENVITFEHCNPLSIWRQSTDYDFVFADLVFLGDTKRDSNPKTTLTPDLGPILSERLTPPEALWQPVTAPRRGEDSVSDSSVQSPHHIEAIPVGAVTNARQAFGNGSPHSPPRNPGSMLGGGNKEGRIRWPNPNFASKKSLPFPSRVGASAATTIASSERRQASDSGSRSDVAVEDTHSLETFSTASYLASFVGQEPIETTRDISKNIATGTVQATSPQQAIALSTPPQSPSPPPPPPSPLFTPYSSPPPSPPQPPPPARAKLGYLPSSPVAITPGYVSLTETDQAP